MLLAQGQVKTEKAQRYLKALCNHFSHKVQATYNDDRGNVDFGFGTCELQAEADTLTLQIQADNNEGFARVKYVVADHLERFSGDEALQIMWIDQD